MIIKPVATISDKKKFIRFPFSLYKNCPQWMPPIIAAELAHFDTRKNPIFHNAEAHLFLAYKNNKIVGRIAAIINWTEVNKQNISKIRFGWFDFIDDDTVSQALLNQVFIIGRKNNLHTAEGPVGFSSLDKVGLLTKGFTLPNNLVTWYNYPYYKKHYEQNGLKIEKEYAEYSFDPSRVDVSFFLRSHEIIRQRYAIRALNFKSTKALLPYLDEMFALYNITYSNLANFVPISKEMITYLKKKNFRLANPNYIKFLVDRNNKMVGFAIAMPSYFDAVKQSGGKLFPLGYYRLKRARQNSKSLVFYLIGIHPAYQKKGLHAIIFYEFYKNFQQDGIKKCYRTPELTTNTAQNLIWKRVNPIKEKVRKTFTKKL